ncbi:MAG: TetR/AcrR family transcriptional regulator [Lachnotalea sp.]
MLKKLTQEKMIEILEVGIAEFADRGLDGANMKAIAKKAGISVGVLYKYYEDKDAFFLACLRKSLEKLEAVIKEVVSSDEKILVRAEKLIRAVLYYSREYGNYINMYKEITSSSSKKFAPLLALEIESITSKTYTTFIKKAMDEGDIRDDIDPRLFAFFFDNLLTSLQFSYCCDYYKERLKVFCGESILEEDEKVVSEMLKFIESAFTFSQANITHKK